MPLIIDEVETPLIPQDTFGMVVFSASEVER